MQEIKANGTFSPLFYVVFALVVLHTMMLGLYFRRENLN